MLTREQLIESCRKNGLTSLRCEQDYEATEQDVLDDNPELAADSDDAQYPSPDAQKDRDLKESVMCRMLEENLDFGPLMETDDEADRDDHCERMEARCDIVEKVAERWVSGAYTGKLKSELELAQNYCESLVTEWYGSTLLFDMAFEIMGHTNDDLTVENADVAEYLGRMKIAEFYQITGAHNVEEFISECTCGLSGSPLDGSPFDCAAAEAYAREYWEAHHE
jgi:hypothetical protein